MRPGQVFSKTCLIALRILDVVELKILHVGTGIVLVYFSVPEFCLPQFLIVVLPGTLPILQFACSWWILLFLVSYSVLTYIACLM